MNETICKNCQYFRQHYSLSDGKLFRLFCGHCTVYPRKRKKPDSSACDAFSPGTPDTEAFATKEYLSKKLLDRVLTIDLLPEITDLPAPQKRG